MAWRRSNLAKFRFSKSFTITETLQVRLKRESVHCWKPSLGGSIPGFFSVGNTACWSWRWGSPPPTSSPCGASHDWEPQGCLLTLPWISQKGKTPRASAKPAGKRPSLALPTAPHGGQAPGQNSWTFALKILTTSLMVLVMKNFQLYHVPQKAN